MQDVAPHRREIKRSSWLWKPDTKELSFGESFSEIFGAGSSEICEGIHDKVLKRFSEFDFSDSEVPFYVRTSHQGEEDEIVIEWLGEVVERNKSGEPTLVSGYAERDYSNPDFSLSLNQEALFFMRLMDNIKESVFFKDLHSRFLKVNKACARKFGVDEPSEIVGKTDFDFFEKDHAQPAYEDEQQIIRTEEPIYDQIEKEVFKGGKVAWTSTSKMPLYDDNGVLIGTYGITRDITKLKLAEEKLKKSDEMFHQLSERVPGFFYQYKFEKGGESYFPFASEGIREIYELSPEDVKNDVSAIRSRIHKDDIEHFVESLKHSAETLDEWKCDYRVNLPEKGRRWLRGNATLEKKNDRTLIGYGYIRDITPEKKAQKKLKQRDELFSELSSHAPGFLYLHKVDRKDNVTFPFVSDGIKKVLELEPEDLKNGIRPLLSRVHKDDLKRVMESISWSVKTQQEWNCEYRVVLPEQGLRWVRGKAKPELQDDGSVLSSGFLSDITREKSIAEQNERLREQFEAVLNTVPNLIFVKGVDGRYKMANKAACEFFGVTRDEIVGKKDVDLGVPEQLACGYHATDVKVASTKEPVFIPEIRSKDNSGNEVYHQTIKVPFQQEGSDEVAVLAVITDITERKQREQELDETLDIVGEQNKRLLNFAHIVSHNLRNHAGNISMLISLFDIEESEEEKEELMGYLKTASERLNVSIEDLNEIIDQQYKTEKDLKELKPAEMLKKVKEILVSDILNHNVKFIEDVDEDLIIKYNPAYLESIMLNMVSNAIKYRDPDKKPKVRIKIYEEGESAYLEVADNGLGIDMEKHGDKLFGMYNTFHGNENSKGIGLFITKNQIESMGGSIKVESEPGKGTTFKIKLA